MMRCTISLFSFRCCGETTSAWLWFKYDVRHVEVVVGLMVYIMVVRTFLYKKNKYEDKTDEKEPESGSASCPNNFDVKSLAID